MKFPKFNVLVAYPYFKKFKPDQIEWFIKNREDIRFVLDSGAFTAWNAGKPIKLSDFMGFIKNLPFQPDHVVQLDIIGDEQGSYRNFLKMLEGGVDCLPVFTRGASLKTADKLYSHSDYILLGGVASGAANDKYTDWFMQHNKGRKVHWLGFTNSSYISKWKPMSVDSSTYNTPVRYGALVHIYKGQGKIEAVTYEEFKKNPEKRKKVLDFVRFWFPEVDISILKNRQEWVCWNFLSKVSCVSHALRSTEIEMKLGTIVYHAANGFDKLQYIKAGYDRVRQRRSFLC